MPAPPIDVALRPSRLYGYGLSALHAATYPLLLSADLPGTVRAQLLVLALLLSLRAWRHWRAMARWRHLRVAAGETHLLALSAEPEAVSGAPTLLTSWLVIMPVRSAAGRSLMPLLPDAMSAVDWRRLQVWWRCGSAARDREH